MPISRCIPALVLALTLALHPAAAVSAAQAPAGLKTDPEIERMLSSMSLAEKVGQIFCVYFDGPALSPELADMIRNRHVGGVILYSAAGNIEDNRQTAALNADMQREAAASPAGIGLFVSVDQEGGPVARFTKHFTVMPSNMAVAATGRPENAALAAQIMGRELGALGVNVNFAPVADVNANPQNPIIGIRSFGSDPQKVAAFTAAAVAAYKRETMLCTPKHFPGHGDTATDSHLGLPLAGRDAASLEMVDFPPFRAAFAAGADAVMTAHVELPAIEPRPGTPATLSRAVLTGLLREKMAFSGLIFTDSMRMGALAKHFGVEEASIRAIQAGADVLLFGADRGAEAAEQRRAMDGVINAAKNGTIPVSRLDDSARRILAVKKAYGILHACDIPAPPKNIDAFTGTAAHGRTALAIAQKSITLVRNQNRALPFSPTEPTLVIRPRRNRPTIDAAAETSIANWPNIQLMAVSEDPSEAEIRSILGKIPKVKNMVILTYDAIRRPGQVRLVRELAAVHPEHFAVAATGGPYDLMAIPELPVYVCSYGDVPASLKALGRSLFGQRPMPGVLPVMLPESAKP